MSRETYFTTWQLRNEKETIQWGPDCDLQQPTSVQNVAQIVREHGLRKAKFYAWKSKDTGASGAELTWLKHLEEENRRLKQVFTGLSLKNQAIKEMLLKEQVALGVEIFFFVVFACIMLARHLQSS